MAPNLPVLQVVTEPSFRVTLDIAQLVLLGGLVYGLARMSKSLDTLKEVTDGLVTTLRLIAKELADLTGRVLVLEDRGRRE